MADVPEKMAKAQHPYAVDSTKEVDVEDRHSDIFFAAVETTRMPMLITNPRQPDNPIIFANQAFLAMTGYAPEELVGRNCRFLQGPETDKQTIAEVRGAIAEHRQFATEILNYRKDGSTFWNALYVSPVHDKDGNLRYFFGSQLDVSRRKEAEAALQQSQKMEALGQLTGGIAHDFNNLLQVISGYSELIGLQASKDEIDTGRIVRANDAVKQATAKAGRLTSQLLAFARKQRLEGRPINLNMLLEGMDDLGHRTLGDDINLQFKLAANLWSVRVDPTQAEVSILNILINARDAMPKGGAVTVESRNLSVGPHDGAAFEGLRPGQYVALAITDEGTGMPEDVVKRVTEPFFTTKPEGKGTGLGLSMVYGFMKQSGGLLRIYSEEGIGTTLRLYFPASDARPDLERQAPRNPAADRKGDETILIVDDREEVGEITRQLLEGMGYDLHVAIGAREAIGWLNETKKVDMIFSDLIMPDMSGAALARLAREKHPRIKVLLATAYAEASIERSDAGGQEFEILNKPFLRQDLVRRVRRVLDGPTGVG